MLGELQRAPGVAVFCLEMRRLQEKPGIRRRARETGFDRPTRVRNIAREFEHHRADQVQRGIAR